MAKRRRISQIKIENDLYLHSSQKDRLLRQIELAQIKKEDTYDLKQELIEVQTEIDALLDKLLHATSYIRAGTSLLFSICIKILIR